LSVSLAAQNPRQFNDNGVTVMWKLVLGFVVFAALALFVLMKGGGNIDMGGEKHDVTAAHEPAASAASAASAAATIEPASAPASAASQ
jgi:hypothetical protein